MRYFEREYSPPPYDKTLRDRRASRGFFYASLIVGGAGIGALLMFGVLSMLPPGCCDSATAAAAVDAIVVSDETSGGLTDCYDDTVVLSNFYCPFVSSSESASRFCQPEYMVARLRDLRRRRDDSLAVNAKDTVTDDYAYATFGYPPVAPSPLENAAVWSELSVMDLRLRLARVACAAKNLMISLGD